MTLYNPMDTEQLHWFVSQRCYQPHHRMKYSGMTKL